MIGTPFLGTCPKELKLESWKDIRTHLSITELFCDMEDVEGEDVEPPKHPTTNDCPKKFSVYA